MTDTFAAGLVTAVFGQSLMILIVARAYLRERWRRIDAEVEQSQVQAAAAVVTDAVRRRLALDDGFERMYRPSRN